MAFKLAEIFTELTVKDSKFKQGLSGARRTIGGLIPTFKRLAFVAAGMFIGATVAAVKFIKLAADQIDQERKLEAVIKATGGAAELSAQQMKDHASELQKLSGISDNAIIEGQALLATFKEIKGQTFKDTTEAMLDMSVIMGTDVKQAALQLGKALNDPERGVTALRRSGVSFTKQQNEMIKKLTQTNKLSQAQAVILGEVQRQFGGAARSIGQSFSGRLKLLSENAGDFGENIGFGLAPFLDDIVKTLNAQVFPALLKAFGPDSVGRNGIILMTDAVRLLGREGIRAKQLLVQAITLGQSSTITGAIENLGSVLTPVADVYSMGASQKLRERLSAKTPEFGAGAGVDILHTDLQQINRKMDDNGMTD
jgi:hypothetical protein